MKLYRIFAIFALIATLSLTACEDYEFNLTGEGGGSGAPKANAFVIVREDTFLLSSMGDLRLYYDYDGLPTNIGDWYIDYRNKTMEYADADGTIQIDCQFKLNKAGCLSSLTQKGTSIQYVGNDVVTTEETNDYTFRYDKQGHITSYKMNCLQVVSDSYGKETDECTITGTFTWDDNTLTGFMMEYLPKGAKNAVIMNYDILLGEENLTNQPVRANQIMFPDNFGELVYSGMLGIWSDTLITAIDCEVSDDAFAPEWQSYLFRYVKSKGKIDSVECTVRLIDGSPVKFTDVFKYDRYFN